MDTPPGQFDVVVSRDDDGGQRDTFRHDQPGFALDGDIFQTGVMLMPLAETFNIPQQGSETGVEFVTHRHLAAVGAGTVLKDDVTEPMETLRRKAQHRPNGLLRLEPAEKFVDKTVFKFQIFMVEPYGFGAFHFQLYSQSLHSAVPVADLHKTACQFTVEFCDLL